MSNMNFNEGFLLGTIISSFVLVFGFTAIRDQGREDCDKKLPRNEKCVQIWVPEKAVRESTP